MKQHPAGSARSIPGQPARSADLVMLVTAVFSAVGAIAIASRFGAMPLALGAGAAILAVAAGAFALLRGTLLAQLTLVACNVALVVLHIHLGRGTIEFHFGVFVLTGLALVYRDWRAVVATALLFALHHVVFDRLQAAGYAVYCTPDADFPRTLLHAVYLVAQTAIEIALALRLQGDAVCAQELSSMADRIDQGEAICLDLESLPVTAPVAVRLKSAIGRIGLAMAEVSSAAASIGTATAEIASGNADLSQRTESQASNVQQTAASMDELTATVKNTAATADQAAREAGCASETALRGGRAMEDITALMAGISRSSAKIADITGVIDGIAFQTNILALNAAVEAARAGEQGRGFAVVASEVRSLAQRSAGAAREIKSLIGSSVDEIDSGARLVGDAGTTIAEIVAQVTRVGGLIREISQAANEQSGGIGLVGQAVGQLDETTQQNSALTEQSAAATESLRQQVVQLNAVVGRFALQGTAARQ